MTDDDVGSGGDLFVISKTCSEKRAQLNHPLSKWEKQTENFGREARKID
jgi:hypothetical protein